MDRIKWTQVGVFAAIVFLIFMVGITVLPFFFGGYGGWGMMGPRMMGGERWGGWWPFCGGTGRSPGGFYGGIFGWLFMLPVMLIPLGLLVLLALGIIWVVRTVGRPSGEAEPSALTCPKCGKAVEVDWRVCPFCEEDLQKLG